MWLWVVVLGFLNGYLLLGFFQLCSSNVASCIWLLWLCSIGCLSLWWFIIWVTLFQSWIYREWGIHIFWDLDIDKWSYFECLDTVKDLGYTRGKFKVWWRAEEDVESHKFRPILTDNEAMVCASFVLDNKVDLHFLWSMMLKTFLGHLLILLHFLDGNRNEPAAAINKPPPKLGPSKPFKPPAMKPKTRVHVCTFQFLHL